MKFIAGWMMPGDELRPVARLVEPLVLVVERARSPRAGGRTTLTMAWPVCISSTWPLSAPVDAHWATNCFCERLMMRIVTTSDAGHGEQRDQREDRADREHHDQHADDRQQRRDELGQALLERLADVVDVVGDAAQQVAARVVVEVAQRQPAELAVDVLAQPVDGPLGDAGHDVGLHPAEERAEQVDRRRAMPRIAAERAEVDARAGREVMAASMSASWSWPLARGARRRPAPGSPRPGSWPLMRRPRR